MEKVVYLLMGPGADALPAEEVLWDMVRRRALCDSLGEHSARCFQLNVVDPRLGPPFGMSPPEDAEQLRAMVSWWVPTAQGSMAHGCLPSPGRGRWDGYVVCESVPLENTVASPGAEGRVPCLAQLVPLRKPESLDWSEWRRRWQGDHTEVAVATQSTFRYVQNVVLRPLGEAPALDAIVEECFPVEAATDIHVFFDSGGDAGRLGENMAAMSRSCDRFMEGVAPVAWTAEFLP